ncbi:MAG: hypothetical protein PHD76_05350 [Methylacidiphilales bacterium]|nr:hypothetical protein [Candidatus Methylacidiphilales bacterium]
MDTVFKIQKGRALAWTLSQGDTLRNLRVDSYAALCNRGAMECRKAAPSKLLIYNESGNVRRAIEFALDHDTGQVIPMEQDPSEF